MVILQDFLDRRDIIARRSLPIEQKNGGRIFVRRRWIATGHDNRCDARDELDNPVFHELELRRTMISPMAALRELPNHPTTLPGRHSVQRQVDPRRIRVDWQVEVIELKLSQSSQPEYVQTAPTPLSVVLFPKRRCSYCNALLGFLPSRKRFVSAPAPGKRPDRAGDTPR